MNLKNAQLEVDTWIKEHGVRYFNELTNMAQLTEEVGEVARIIARRYGEQSEKRFGLKCPKLNFSADIKVSLMDFESNTNVI